MSLRDDDDDDDDDDCDLKNMIKRNKEVKDKECESEMKERM